MPESIHCMRRRWYDVTRVDDGLNCGLPISFLRTSTSVPLCDAYKRPPPSSLTLLHRRVVRTSAATDTGATLSLLSRMVRSRVLRASPLRTSCPSATNNEPPPPPRALAMKNMYIEVVLAASSPSCSPRRQIRCRVVRNVPPIESDIGQGDFTVLPLKIAPAPPRSPRFLPS